MNVGEAAINPDPCMVQVDAAFFEGRTRELFAKRGVPVDYKVYVDTCYLLGCC